MKTIKGFILIAALAVSVLLFFGVYGVASRVHHHQVADNARQLSEVLASQTYHSLVQVMRRGWEHQDVLDFLAATRRSYADTSLSLNVYRGQPVADQFGTSDQPAIDGPVAVAMRTGQSQQHRGDGSATHVFPLMAERACLECHRGVGEGDVLGAVEVHQDLGGFLGQAKTNFLWAFLPLAPLPLVVAWGVATLLSRRINRSVQSLDGSIERIRSVADLREVEMPREQLGFAELNDLAGKVHELADKMRLVAVDKDLLEFEIRLLEKFVITSEVVQDWQGTIKQLLAETNAVMEVYFLFSLFKVDEEVYDLELFWLHRPDEEVRGLVTERVRAAVNANARFGASTELAIRHHVADGRSELAGISEQALDLQTKDLLLDSPKIGGLVGLGADRETTRDPTRLLITEGILSTLLNVVGSVRAIAKYTRDLEYYASRDPLTDLYNQRTFREFLDYEVDRAGRRGYPFALLLVDLDNFKSVNDHFGHQLGDRFLQAFARAIGEALRGGDVLARYGGDEFVILLPETDADQARATAHRVMDSAQGVAVATPDGGAVRATVSLGVAIYPDHADAPNDLFLFADNMMYRAKSEGKNRVGMPTEEDVVEIFRELGEKSHLVQEAIDHHRVVPYYQPIRGAMAGEVVGHEVLSRIRTADGVVVGAGEFIEHAERMGVVHQMDFQVMGRAFADAAECGYDGLLFINLSPRALVLNEFLGHTRELVARYGIRPASVVFELTERDTVRNLAVLERFVSDLKQDGFKFAVDDFGSGFSSFHYLKRLPIDFVKIEGEFVANMAHDARDYAFVKSMATLADELGIQTVAEFIEDEDVLAAVRGVAIPLAQGFHLGRPGPDLA